MISNRVLFATVCALAASAPGALSAQTAVGQPPDTIVLPDVKALVARLGLEPYKATVKGLTQFGDRRQGTKRNRDAIDWIEAQLKSYGCAPERLTYTFTPRGRGAGGGAGAGGRGGRGGAGGDSTGGRAGRVPSQWGPGGSRLRGPRELGVNSDSLKQPDPRVRALDTEQTPPGPGERQEVFCTKVGTTHPEEMYIVGGHMDGIGWGEAANDDGSGTALVMELARVFSMPDVQTERSIRFALWNNEESGLDGARAYVTQREAKQGIEDPPGSKKYPEPKWLGMIQHDMMMFDHGKPHPDRTMSPQQRPEADVNVEFQGTAKMAEGAQKLAWFFATANDKYATDYPASVGQHMSNTDSDPFKDIIPAISLRENERGAGIGASWDPQHHQPTDMFSTYSDDDFRLGMNAAQTTLSAVATLTGASIKK